MMQLVMHKMESYTANKQTNNNAMALLTLTVGVNHGSVYSRISPLGKGGGKESEIWGCMGETFNYTNPNYQASCFVNHVLNL